MFIFSLTNFVVKIKFMFIVFSFFKNEIIATNKFDKFQKSMFN